MSSGREEWVNTCRRANEAIRSLLPCAWQYLRRKRQGRVGVVVAVLLGEDPVLGWSLCNVHSGDRFDPEVAFHKAYQRALERFRQGEGVHPPADLPHSLRAVWAALSTRASRWTPRAGSRGVFLGPPGGASGGGEQPSLSPMELGGEG